MIDQGSNNTFISCNENEKHKNQLLMVQYRQFLKIINLLKVSNIIKQNAFQFRDTHEITNYKIKQNITKIINIISILRKKRQKLNNSQNFDIPDEIINSLCLRQKLNLNSQNILQDKNIFNINTNIISKRVFNRIQRICFKIKENYFKNHQNHNNNSHKELHVTCNNTPFNSADYIDGFTQNDSQDLTKEALQEKTENSTKRRNIQTKNKNKNKNNKKITKQPKLNYRFRYKLIKSQRKQTGKINNNKLFIKKAFHAFQKDKPSNFKKLDFFPRVIEIMLTLSNNEQFLDDEIINLVLTDVLPN
ncbi:uncharacterized protein ASCRUDRAFT_94563 [Ascoidea rubescens DSM 1968]|uniref:Uncharacterized protein n=1 Tax=Ascoidea rubescens DSM 1968 TaxID=1344418 RepID=A0A1D2VP13_9ASCO|nr:hypothetical protein ASCRUDRAFT_94563 [Ascoidea rubescens DSM 1968]ODV63334.1 hypothetical protein ASCRUDRAFT_94563 [Ascoidea rubescens DSM 1968]